MKKLYEHLQHLDPKDGEMFGVEIECEGRNLYPINNNYWKTERDGSLRGDFPNNACEWVMKKPLDLKGTLLAVKSLHTNQVKNNAVFDFSFRTSLHVHMNVSDLTFNQYMALIYAYLLVEEPLIKFCGEGRIGNRFCLRLQDAEGLLDNISYIGRVGVQAIPRIDPEVVRYSAINIAATPKYGSLEFRGMHGTMDVPTITKWITALSNLRAFAVKCDNIQNVHDVFMKEEPLAFLNMAVGAGFEYPGAENDMRYSFSISMQLPYATKLEVEEEEVKVVPAPKKLNRIVLEARDDLNDAIEALRGEEAVRALHRGAIDNPAARVVYAPRQMPLRADVLAARRGAQIDYGAINLQAFRAVPGMIQPEREIE